MKKKTTKKVQSVKKKSSVMEKKVPVAKKKTPVAEKKIVAVAKKPVVLEKKSVVVARKPLILEKRAVAVKKKPVVAEKKVVVEKKPIAAEKQMPVKVVVSSDEKGKKKKKISSLRKMAVDGLRKAIRIPVLKKDVNFRPLLPNFVTMSALACGLSSVHEAFNHRWDRAVLFLLFAGIFDGLDGRVARFFNASSKFGAELDSLSDFISFGVAPGIVLYFWTSYSISWAVVLFLAMCCAFRLARFNTMLDKEPPSKAWTHFFTGLPAPGGAYMACMPLIFWLAFQRTPAVQNFFINPVVVSIFMLVSAVLMASRVPTPSLKKLHFSKAKAGIVQIIFYALLAFLLVRPFLCLSLIAYVYLVAIILGWFYFHLLKKQS